MKNFIGVILIILAGLVFVYVLRSSAPDDSGANHPAVGRPLIVSLSLPLRARMFPLPTGNWLARSA